ncbi:unnamed protein product [Prorocentrum cordatum]|uniref:HTH OST-type domain-containing protein n=1 Tax=Prorocentrum cordatum TaxID=2364126 RepID=A0ABN9X817_9DINO|nr:unnamed protein product [Polarella glacialis]|mmetsp:Transcript_9234/g.24541  ORF Transcript_9234/g.24541 Transcript_9234/m.24541 type:complete len:524 (-) Transcript_9234:118-1689(-)
MGSTRRAPRGGLLVGPRAGAALLASASEACLDSPGSGSSAPPSPRSRAQIVEAIESLYEDRLRPYGRILRKRISERSGGGQECGLASLRARCEACPGLRVQCEEGGEFAVLLSGRPEDFVDIYGGEDVYPEELWAAAADYFGGLGAEAEALPGGRFASAEALASRGLPFLRGYTLGQVCHITQLALTRRRLLGYSDGAIVPYGQSTSMRKSRCATLQCPCAAGDPAKEPLSGLEVASWDVARLRLHEILQRSVERGTNQVPLSNVKRLFRSLFKLELSETKLGHSKLTELLQDPRFADVCEVQLQEKGYAVVPVSGGAQQRRRSPRRTPRQLRPPRPACRAQQPQPPRHVRQPQQRVRGSGLGPGEAGRTALHAEPAAASATDAAAEGPSAGWGAAAELAQEGLWLGGALLALSCGSLGEAEDPPALVAGPRFALEPLSLEEAAQPASMPLATPSPLNVWQGKWPAAGAANAASLPEEAHCDIARTPSPSPRPVLCFGYSLDCEDRVTAPAACRPVIRIAGLI